MIHSTYMSAADCAKDHGVREEQIRRYCQSNRLEHERMGWQYVIRRDVWSQFKKSIKRPGRPRKEVK